jgi:hypothetical protein
MLRDVLMLVRDRHPERRSSRARRRRRLPRAFRHWYRPLSDPVVWGAIAWTAAMVLLVLSRLAVVR